MSGYVSVAAISICLFFSCAQVKKVQQQEPLPTAIPTLRILHDTAASAIRISSLHIEVKVTANIATTTFDMEFYNPNNRMLEGEFDFPLADGQQIVRYGLDIEGKMREGVVAEKAKARLAFENTIRRQVDPGLVEKTKGNNFRTRIYPLPAKGSRHILIAMEQVLPFDAQGNIFQLPLYTAEPIADFAFTITVVKNEAVPEAITAFDDFRFKKWENAWVASRTEKNFPANQTIQVHIPRTGNDSTLVLTEQFSGNRYFYVNSVLRPEWKEQVAPVSVGILWDASASGKSRNLEKEKQLLKQYFAGSKTCTVSLIPFHIYLGEKQEFIIRNGNTDALLEAIDQLSYDGGTQFGAIDMRQYDYEQLLLFSDGLGTFGKKELLFSGKPLISISSSAVADYAHLKWMARESGGRFINLSSTTVEQAVQDIQQLPLQVIRVEADTAAVEDLVFPSEGSLQQGLSFAGKLKQPETEITVHLGYNNTVSSTRRFIVRQSDSTQTDQVKRLWATMKISELELQPEKFKEQITALGKSFSVVTSNTSLIVLDRVEDYVEQEIVPPAELQKEYYALLKQKRSREEQERKEPLLAAVETMRELKDWWLTEYKPVRRNKRTEVELQANQVQLHEGVADAGIVAADSAVVSHNFTTGTVQADRQLMPSPQTEIAELRMEPSAGWLSDAKEEDKKSAADELEKTVAEKPGSIELKDWKPDVPYLKEIEKAKPGDYEAVYTSLKKQYGTQPSFYIDMARFFFARKQQASGVRILSNVAELKLEEASLLRMMANQLMEAGEKELALIAYRDILVMREEEPQSYRDLALACNENGLYAEAVQLFYQLILGYWDNRFHDIQAVALNEMNAVISAHPQDVSTAGIDQRLIYAMPVDVRIVISWNTDNSDMDLWVTDPRKEKCSYENTRTAIGGRITQDVTQGYGPEEFMLKKAMNGDYTVEVNLFGDSRQTLGGPTAIKADLYTDFGKPTQKKQTINFRVSEAKEVVEIGKLKFGV